jgi:aminoglycoside phosphotransferase (APT) family kinase protein
VGVLEAPEESVEAYFTARLERGGLRLAGRWLASEGWSDETGFLTFHTDSGEELRVVVRRYRTAGVSRGETDPERHFRVLRAMSATGVPVPRVLWFDANSDLFDGPFFVMEAVAGFAPVPWSPEGRRYLAEAGSGPPGRQFVDILAAIHRVDWRSVGLADLGGAVTAAGFAADSVERLRGRLDAVEDEPEPILADGIGWLSAHLPERGAVTVVHGDYRTGNLLFTGDRISAVLDWEFACIGDPYYDLGWVCAPTNRTGSDLVCMLLPEADFLRRYADVTGSGIDGASLRFWVTYHQVQHAVRWLEGAAAFSAGTNTDLRLARAYYTLPSLRRMVADLLEYA